MSPSVLGLTKSAAALHTSDGCQIDVWELSITSAVDLHEWAKIFRKHYCADEEIDDLRAGTGLSRSEYLTQLVFPDQNIAPGPAIRAGDFAELLVSDYVEYLLGYWVPRGKYADKASRDESAKGVDILGFRLTASGSAAPTDTLLAFEVKAQLTGATYSGALQKAVTDSSKDLLRRAISLNATKRRLLRAGEDDRAMLVERFQNQSDHPYRFRSGAAAVLNTSAYDELSLQNSTTIADHLNAANLELIVIRGDEVMQLVHALYERAANEA